jgi:twitching motility protein PilU
MSYADSPTNLQWRLQNDFVGKNRSQGEDGASDEDMADEPTFTEITLDVKQ